MVRKTLVIIALMCVVIACSPKTTPPPQTKPAPVAQPKAPPTPPAPAQPKAIPAPAPSPVQTATPPQEEKPMNLPTITADDAAAQNAETVSWGPYTTLSFALMKDLPLAHLFGDATPAEVFGKCASSCDHATNPHLAQFDPKFLVSFQAKLADLADPKAWPDNIKFAALFTEKVGLSPALMGKLRAIDVHMDLPFLQLQDTPDPLVADLIKKLIEHPKFKDMSINTLYETSAGPKEGDPGCVYSYADVCFMAQLLDTADNEGHKVLRSKGFDLLVKVKEQTFVIKLLVPNNKCCNKTTHLCSGTLTGGNCTMCGSFCCLACTWCPGT
jgi:hypothetical protein